MTPAPNNKHNNTILFRRRNGDNIGKPTVVLVSLVLFWVSKSRALTYSHQNVSIESNNLQPSICRSRSQTNAGRKTQKMPGRKPKKCRAENQKMPGGNPKNAGRKITKIRPQSQKTLCFSIFDPKLSKKCRAEIQKCRAEIQKMPRGNPTNAALKVAEIRKSGGPSRLGPLPSYH